MKRLTHTTKTLFTFICAMFLISQAANAQERVIKGKVLDSASGMAIPGANIVIEGSTQGTISDFEGNFTLSVGENTNLTVSYIGYVTKNVTLTTSDYVEVKLEEDAQELEEVIVVGYGTMRKSDVTGSVATVKTDQLTQVATVDVAESLQGRVSGVQVVSNSGYAGSGMKVRIRGVGTINNSDPLYVVDGFPTSDISNIAPSDIASMEILKDASATAIYGSRGANGVVLITTKTGKQNTKTKFNLDVYSGISSPSNQMDMVNASEYATLKLEAYGNDGITPSTRELEQLTYVKDGNFEGTDWQDAIYSNAAPMFNVNFQAMGGGENSNYVFTTTYFNQEGTIDNSGLEKIIVRLNNNFKLTDKISAGINTSYTFADIQSYSGDLYAGVGPSVLRIDPITPVWDDHLNNYGNSDGLSDIRNPARIVEDMENKWKKEHKLMSNLFANYNIIEGLDLRTQYGLDLKTYQDHNYSAAYYIGSKDNNARSSLVEKTGTGLGWVWNATLNYTKEFNNIHRINALVGVETQSSTWSSLQGVAYDVPADKELQNLNNAKNTDDVRVNSSQTGETIMSYFARANYSLLDRYKLTATIRQDGSSKFSEEHRWGVFPSFAASWDMKNEAFLTDVNWLSQLNFRAGWGQVGNQSAAANYGYITNVSSGLLYPLGGIISNGNIPLSLSNPELQWETTEMLNFAFDFGFWDDKLNLVAEYFIKDTKDMILTPPAPAYAGAGVVSANVGEMQNKGFEFNINYRDQVGEFKYEIGLNASFIENEVVKLASGEPIYSGRVDKVGNNITMTKEGLPIATFIGYKTDGIFNTQEELDAYMGTYQTDLAPEVGDIRYVDANGDGKIDDNDITELGSAMPDFTYGVSASLAYKGLDMKLLFTGSQGNEGVNTMTRFNNATDGKEGMLDARLDRWTPENPNTSEPRMTVDNLSYNTLFSDRLVEDASFFRLKNIQIGYTFNQSLMSKLQLTNLRVYVAANNLFTITNYTGYDPEFGDLYGNPLYAGIDMASYPQPRTFLVGLNVSF